MSVLHLQVHCMCKPSSSIRMLSPRHGSSNTGLTFGYEPTSQAGRVDRGDTKVTIVSADHTSRVHTHTHTHTHTHILICTPNVHEHRDSWLERATVHLCHHTCIYFGSSSLYNIDPLLSSLSYAVTSVYCLAIRYHINVVTATDKPIGWHEQNPHS